MANPEHLAQLKKGVAAWNQWRRQNLGVVPDLFEADISGANLVGVNLGWASLAGAHLSGAHLRGAYLRGAYLSDANLSEANLSEANLNGANLSGANLNGARVGYTAFADVDLSQVKGLETVEHLAPSSIGLDTLLKSGGKIPDKFLIGCGYDPVIQHLLVGDVQSKTDVFYEWIGRGGGPLKLQSCFISYSTKDKAFVDRLQKSLNESGVAYWYAPEHGRWGEELEAQIDREIRVRDRLIVVCSTAALHESAWVLKEIDSALEEEKRRKKKVIFPVMLDDALLNWGDQRGKHMLEVLAGDFRGATRGAAFDKALARLLEGLKERRPPPRPSP